MGTVKICEPFILEWTIPPYVDFTRENNTIILDGAYGQLWTTLEQNLGFTSKFVIENYTKGFHEFQNGTRDVLLQPSVVFSDDLGNSNFVLPVTNIWYEVYLRDSDGISSSNSYVRNWSAELWFCTFLMFWVSVILLYGMLQISHRFFHKDLVLSSYESTHPLKFGTRESIFILMKNRKTRQESPRSKNNRSLGCCFMAIMAAFSSQDICLHTNVVSIRILLFTFLVFAMILYNAYSALLISQLTVGDRYLPFNSLEEIPNKDRSYTLCVRPESYPYTHFLVNFDGNVMKRRWKNVINKYPCPKNGRPDFSDLCTSYMAILEAPAIMNPILLRNKKCKITKLPRKYFDGNISLLVKKTIGKKAIDELINELLKHREIGIISRLQRKWLNHAKIPRSNNDEMQISHDHIEGVLLLYYICLGISCIMFLFEILVSYLSKRKTAF